VHFACKRAWTESFTSALCRRRQLFFFFFLLSIACATQELAAVLADGNGVISSQHMHWFFEAEGSRE
jgi:hypothetical protein